jgi:beta-glucosidase
MTMNARITRLLSVVSLLCFSLIAAARVAGQAAPASQADVDQRVEKILSQMTLEEKLDYIGGVNAFYIRGIPRLGVPELKMSDGPEGLRNDGPSTSYPAGINMAATWDTDLEYRVGVQMGRDGRARGDHFQLGPGVNIYRAPMCGRNFEYFGEDPFLAGRIAVAVIKGIQSQGVIATVKHYMGNNQEWSRNHVSSDIDERTMREIYLPAFEAAVKEGHVGAIMDSYNLINGVYATANPFINIQVAKKDWGFKGIIMSDWGAAHDAVADANAGLDLEMPSGEFMNPKNLLPAIQDGRVTQATIDDKVRRILRTAIEFGFFDHQQLDPKLSLLNQEGRKVELEASLGGMVLLKNNGTLPFDASKLKSIAVIGPRAYPDVPEGNGSGFVHPFVSGSFLEGISNRLLGTGAPVFYSDGTRKPEDIAQWTDFSTTPDGKQAGLTGEYFDNEDLQGTPAMVRTDAHVHFGFRGLTYTPATPDAHWSARWTGYFIPPATGDYVVYVGGQSGFRLFVDDKMVIEQWGLEGASPQTKALALEAGKPYKIRLEYYRGGWYRSFDFGIVPSDSPELKKAREIAAGADAVVLCIGLDSTIEGEGSDRNFDLPADQESLIKAVLSVNKNVAIVVTAGGNVGMTQWIDSAPAVLHAWYPGQEGGTALAKILFGDVSPSGKLPASFERRWEDNATYDSYYDKNGSKHVAYTEGVFLGYRHFDKTGIKPMFPFGYGLSYTTFKYSNLKVTPSSFQGDDPVTVSFDITNTGKREGAEVAEVYVSDGHSKIERPVKELKGFSKVNLKPGETRSVKVSLNRRAFSYYDVNKKDWVAEPGEFGILVGASSAQIELTGKVALKQ